MKFNVILEEIGSQTLLEAITIDRAIKLAKKNDDRIKDTKYVSTIEGKDGKPMTRDEITSELKASGVDQKFIDSMSNVINASHQAAVSRAGKVKDPIEQAKKEAKIAASKVKFNRNRDFSLWPKELKVNLRMIAKKYGLESVKPLIQAI